MRFEAAMFLKIKDRRLERTQERTQFRGNSDSKASRTKKNVKKCGSKPPCC